MTPQISIIIPVFNSAETIVRCIDSVLIQDFSDFEVLLVDDGSTDESLSVMQEQGERDNRIRVFHKENGGVSSARNLALDNARGEYVCFIDSDDYVEPNYLSAMYEHRDCDMVVCGYFVDWMRADGTLIRQEKAALQQVGEFEISDGCDCIYDLFANGKIHINCNKLLKRSIIDRHNIRYTPIPVNEDYMFMIEYLKHAMTIYATDVVTYHWIQLEGVRRGVDSIPKNLLSIYLCAQQKTSSLFSDVSLVSNIFYFSYFLMILKYVYSWSDGTISKSEMFESLDTVMSNPIVKEAFLSRKGVSEGERLMNFLLMHRMYRMFVLLRKVCI